jgi:hypothetical protein
MSQNLFRPGFSFADVGQPAPIKYNIGSGVYGSYNNIKFELQQSKPAPLLSGKIYVPQGTPLPLGYEAKAVELPRDTRFQFAYNYASPACCITSPSQFSTDRGCVCLTPNQAKYMGSRGNNKNFVSDPDF